MIFINFQGIFNKFATIFDMFSSKAQCQRFGMKSMGEAFKDITRPQDCVAKCAELYKA